MQDNQDLFPYCSGDAAPACHLGQDDYARGVSLSCVVFFYHYCVWCVHVCALCVHVCALYAVLRLTFFQF